MPGNQINGGYQLGRHVADFGPLRLSVMQMFPIHVNLTRFSLALIHNKYRWGIVSIVYIINKLVRLYRILTNVKY